MENKDKEGFFKKIANKWNETRENVSEKFRSAKETIKEKFKQKKTKIAVTVGSLVLAGALALTVAVSCNKDEIFDLGNDIQYETNINGDVIKETTLQDYIQNNQQGNNQENTQNIKKDLETYLFNNPEYVEAIASSRAGSDISKTAVFDPHPYAYLEQKGHDVEAIKNGSIECETMSYTLNEQENSLFIATKIYENDVATHYHIEYKLSKDDMKLYNLAHDGPYYETAFINDAISEIYKPVNETCFKISAINSKGIDKAYNYYKEYMNSNYVSSYVVGIDLENSVFKSVILPKYGSSDYRPSNSTKLVTLNTKSLVKITKDGELYNFASAISGMQPIDGTLAEGRFHDIQSLNWHYCVDGFQDSLK